MKGLAMSQPWAELVISGKKKIEVRTKNTKHRGWFYIYAAKKDTKEKVMQIFGYNNLPTGVIIGKAFLENVKRYQNDKEFYRDSELHCATRKIIKLEGWDMTTKYGYLITKVQRVETVPYRGMPSFFPVKKLSGLK